MPSSTGGRTEIIAFGSGKGGTGKTLIASCLGYALVRAGHRVLMVDADAGTDGLSLFLLGPKGAKQIEAFSDSSTFTGALKLVQRGRDVSLEPRRINRLLADDHGVAYEALISTNRIYGDGTSYDEPVVPDLDRRTFRSSIAALFEILRNLNYDYVLTDTRGGFAFESTDVCALADSFIVVTEPDFTSFYQDRNLIKHISATASALDVKPLLRSVIVNKATDITQSGDRLDLDKIEQSFRLELTREFPIRFEDTHPIPIDIEAIQAYKTQRMPLVTAPGSSFSFATLSAYGDILQIVTSAWPEERVNRWNELVETVSQAVEKRNATIQEGVRAQQERDREVEVLRKERVELTERGVQLTRELKRVEDQHQREIARSERVFTEVSSKRGEREFESLLPWWSQRLLPEWFQRLPRSVRRVSELYLILLVLSIPLYYWYFNYRPDQLFQKLYEPGPLPIRAGYFRVLVGRYHRSNFESLSLPNANLVGAPLDGISLRGADLEGVDLTRSSLRDADLGKARLSGAQLQQANLSGANLEGADLEGADLRGANLSGADLRDARVNLNQLTESILDERTVRPDGTRGP